MNKTVLLDLNVEEMQAYVKEKGQPAFRGKQLFSWLHQGISFEQMSNLPLPFRIVLREEALDLPIKVLEVFTSQKDDTVKFLYSLQDGNCVEGVLMSYHHGYSLCVSTQVGCKMGCTFCASTLNGWVRNLSAGEILGQIIAANNFLKGEHKISNVVLMGSGEPLDNYDEVVKFLCLLKEKEGVNLSLRNISLSTCGLVPKIKDLADEGLPVTLCISLHAPNDEIRQKSMPIAKLYTMDGILEACRYYLEKTGRRIIFEYALIRNLNSAPIHAKQLAQKLRGLQCHVNLIPLNEVKERNLETVSKNIAQTFLKALEEEHISATLRRTMGEDIGGACGQLRRSRLELINDPGVMPQ